MLHIIFYSLYVKILLNSIPIRGIRSNLFKIFIILNLKIYYYLNLFKKSIKYLNLNNINDNKF